jgi:hypothetical protein
LNYKWRIIFKFKINGKKLMFEIWKLRKIERFFLRGSVFGFHLNVF